MQAVGRGFMDAYRPIVARRKAHPWAIVSVSSSSTAVVAMWSLIWCGTAARCLVCRPAVALSRS